MLTIRLNIKENAVDRVMASLKAFSLDEVIIVSEDQSFSDTQTYLRRELEDLQTGNPELLSHEELEKSLEEVLGKYENPL